MNNGGALLALTGLGVLGYIAYKYVNQVASIDSNQSLVETTTNQAANIADTVIGGIENPLQNIFNINMNTTKFLSGNGINFIKSLEGFSEYPYTDSRGKSIGYGHYIKTFESIAHVTQAEAEQLLARDVAEAVMAVNDTITVPLTQNQFDALVSFTYNVGVNAFKTSTLARKINNNDPSASAEFARWNKSNGKILPALISRRQAEMNLYLQG